MEYVTVYSGSEINALAVRNILDNNQIEYIIREDVNAGVVAGFGTLDRAVHVLVLENVAEKAKTLVLTLNV